MTSVGENYTLQFGNKHRTVFVAEAVVNTWRKNKQTKINQSEMCGVLIGATSRDKKTIWVESVTSALPLDVRYRYNFVMKDPGHQAVRKFTLEPGTRILKIIRIHLLWTQWTGRSVCVGIDRDR